MIYHEFKVITPNIAKEMMLLNKSNRAINRQTLLRYENDMMDGKWVNSGIPIIFDDNNNLIDGQHRLQACINSGKSFYTSIIRNSPHETFEVVDSGKTRSAADILTIKGFNHSIAQHATAAATFCIPFERHKTFSFSLDRRHLVSPRNRADWVKNTPRICEIIEMIFSIQKKSSFCFIPKSQIGFLWFFMEKKEFKLTYDFFYGVLTKIGLSEKDPRLALLNKAEMNANSSSKLSRELKWGCVIRAWSWYVRGKDVKYYSNCFRDLSSAINLLK